MRGDSPLPGIASNHFSTPQIVQPQFEGLRNRKPLFSKFRGEKFPSILDEVKEQPSKKSKFKKALKVLLGLAAIPATTIGGADPHPTC